MERPPYREPILDFNERRVSSRHAGETGTRKPQKHIHFFKGLASEFLTLSYSWEEIDIRSICTNVLLDYSSVRD